MNNTVENPDEMSKSEIETRIDAILHCAANGLHNLGVRNLVVFHRTPGESVVAQMWGDKEEGTKIVMQFASMHLIEAIKEGKGPRFDDPDEPTEKTEAQEEQK